MFPSLSEHILGSRTTRPSGYVESYGHDLLGRTTSFTNAESRVTTQTFDAQDRLLATVNAAGERLFLNRYDPLGNLTNHLDGANNSSVYQYDVLNRNTSVTYSDDTTETFAYDAVGNLTAASKSASRLTFGCDAMNRLVSAETRVAGQTFTVGYGYGPGGLATNIVYPGNKTLHYAYDTDGRVTSATDWNNRTFTSPTMLPDGARRAIALRLSGILGMSLGCWESDVGGECVGVCGCVGVGVWERYDRQRGGID